MARVGGDHHGKCIRVDTYEPFDEIMKGDVILWNGSPRLVRRVVRTQEDALRIIEFTKQRCSGYPSPTTLYWRSKVRKSFGGIVGHIDNLCRTELECRVQREVEDDSPVWRPPIVTEKEVVGVVP